MDGLQETSQAHSVISDPPAMSPIDALARELGAVARRIEREVDLRVAAVVAYLKRMDAERELRLAQMENAMRVRLAELKDGKDGKDGEKGEKGDTGPQGEPGPQGPAGLPGERGADGRDGTNGEKGDIGPRGERGEPGERGLAGERGERGEPGIPGQAGETGPQGLTGEKGEKGDRGDPGRTIKHRGTYDAAKTYAELDVAVVNGSSFIAIKDGAGVCPGPDWRIQASAGKRGERGERGEQGLPGPRGESGKPAPALRECQIDKANFRARLVMDDGNTLDIPVAPFFEQYEDERQT